MTIKEKIKSVVITFKATEKKINNYQCHNHQIIMLMINENVIFIEVDLQVRPPGCLSRKILTLRHIYTGW